MAPQSPVEAPEALPARVAYPERSVTSKGPSRPGNRPVKRHPGPPTRKEADKLVKMADLTDASESAYYRAIAEWKRGL
jgi:hypothetical protein